MTGEGQVVKLDVGAEHDALANGVHRAGAVERLGEGRAVAIVAADASAPVIVTIADADGVAAFQSEDIGAVAVADA